MIGAGRRRAWPRGRSPAAWRGRTAGPAPRRRRTSPPCSPLRIACGDELQRDRLLPAPAGPSSRVLEPCSMPPPSSASSPATPVLSGRGRTCCGARPPPGAGRPAAPPVADDEIVVAATKALRAILHDPKPPALGAIVRRQFLQPDDAVSDAVHRLVERVGRQVVEQQHGRAVAREIMLERQDLAAIAQRTLREQADLRQRVEHDALRLAALERLEDQLGGLAELEIGRIEQALLLIRIEQALGRHQLEDLDFVTDRPAMRVGAARSSCSVSDSVM